MGKVTPIKGRYEAGFWSEYNPTPPASQSADAEINSAGANLRNWARYLAKNSSIAKAVLDARVSKGIGTGLRYEPMIRNRRGDLLVDLNEQIKQAHTEWSRRVDVTRELSRQDVEALVWRDWDTVGEVFARRVYRGRTAQQIGYQLQLIRSEMVPYHSWNGQELRLGITRGDWGEPITYHVTPYAQTSSLWSLLLPNQQEPVEIPADEICHLRRQEELDATRGVTLFHAVIFRASDIAEYQQSHRRAARASANLFASINRDIGADLNEQPPEYAGPDQSQLNLMDLQIIDYLREGESVNFHAANHPNQNAVEFVNQELRQLAAACRVAFSWIAYVFDRAYAAQRTELVHAWEMIYQDRAQFVENFARPCLYEEPLRMALLEGRLPARLMRQADPATLYDVRIDGPVMPSIDPLADRKAGELDQQMGWDSRYGIIRRFGRDPKYVDAEREKDDFEPATMQQQNLPLETNTDDEAEP